MRFMKNVYIIAVVVFCSAIVKGRYLYPMAEKTQGQGHKAGAWQSESQVQVQRNIRSLGWVSACLSGALLVPKSNLKA